MPNAKLLKKFFYSPRHKTTNFYFGKLLRHLKELILLYINIIAKIFGKLFIA